MSTKTLKIYATSNSTDGQSTSQDYFKMDEKVPPVTVFFEIPSNIKKYRLKTLGFKTDVGTASAIFINLTGNGIITNKVAIERQKATTIEMDGNSTYTSLRQSYLFTQLTAVNSLYMYVCGAKNAIESDRPYIEIEYVETDVSDLTITGNNMDEEITVSWQGLCDSWTLQAILNDIVVKSWTGTTATSQIITKGSLTTSGNYTFKLIAEGGDSTEITTIANLTRVEPTISSLEPDNVNQNVDNDITLFWVSANQQSYKLEIDGITYSGTTQKALRIPGGTLIQGTKILKLTIYYISSWGEVRSAVKTVSFIGYGKPVFPILSIKKIYNTAEPTLRWSSSGQVSYRVIITSGIATIVDTQEVISTNLYYTLSTALANNTNYAIKLKIKNQYNLWSDEITDTFRTEFNVPTIPSVTATADSTGAIIINVSSAVENDTEYKNTEIWRRESLGEWVRMAYNLEANTAYRDFYVASGVEYEYKARNIGQSGGISEGDVVSAITKVQGYTLFDVEDMSNSVKFKNDVSINPKFNQNVATNIYAGNEKPTTEQGIEAYYDGAISFKTTDKTLQHKLIKLIRAAKVLLFKDSKGHKYFVNIIGGISFNEDNLGIITVSFQFVETNFLEQDVYAGENSEIKLIKWDGTWAFDGTHSFNNE